MDHYHNVSRERPKEKRAMHDDDSLMQNLMTSKSMKSKFFVSSRRFRRPDLNFFYLKWHIRSEIQSHYFLSLSLSLVKRNGSNRGIRQLDGGQTYKTLS